MVYAVLYIKDITVVSVYFLTSLNWNNFFLANQLSIFILLPVCGHACMRMYTCGHMLWLLSCAGWLYDFLNAGRI